MHAYIDTQVAVRLATGDSKKISRIARAAIDRYEILLSPMVRMELEYLFELGRCPRPSSRVLEFLERTCDVTVCPLPFDRVARAACHESWTRDAFDRFIVAHARCAPDAYLITADETIRANYHRAVW